MTGGDDLNGLVTVIVGIFNMIGGALETLIGSMQLLFGGFIAVFTGDTEALKNAWVVVCDGIKTVTNGTFKVVGGIFTSIKNLFNELIEVVNKIIDSIGNFGSALKNALNIDGLIEKVKSGLSNLLPDWVKSSLGINEEGKQTEQPTIYEGTDAPIVPDVQNMQAMKAQSKGNVNNNISRSQVFNIGSNNPAVVTATMREADYEMNNADRAIAMASQGAGW
jgi:phage-related protein